jgi:hypothetical protein
MGTWQDFWGVGVQTAVVDIDEKVNGTGKPEILSSRFHSGVGEEECHRNLRNVSGGRGTERSRLTNAPITIVYLRPRSLVLHLANVRWVMKWFQQKGSHEASQDGAKNAHSIRD